MLKLYTTEAKNELFHPFPGTYKQADAPQSSVKLQKEAKMPWKQLATIALTVVTAVLEEQNKK